MSKKSRERRDRHKNIQPDSYYYDGIFEVARFGKNTLIKNHRTPEQQMKYIRHLQTEYPVKYAEISKKVFLLREKVAQCDPYSLLMFLRSAVLSLEMNTFSEFEYSVEANAIIRASEYVQSLLVSTKNKYKSPISEEKQGALYEEILADFIELYKEVQIFYFYWAEHTQDSTGISGDYLDNIVEAQYMYWVRGNRYQIFELEPLKSLLPPHDTVLQELFGMSANDIICGLEKLRYSLSQGYADAMMELFGEYQRFVEATRTGMEPEAAYMSRMKQTRKIADKVFGSDLIDVKAITGWDDRFINALSLEVGEYQSFWNDSEFSGWPIIELPVARKPFIKISGTSYAFLYYALFDNIYRNIQKSIIQRKPEYQNSWKERQTHASEKMVAELFHKLLPNSEIYTGNYYPVNASLKKMNENDIIIIYQNYLFIIEVKAGAFPSTPPITDFNAHISAYHNLAEKADSQCSRTLDYITKHSPAQFYGHDKTPTFCLPELKSFDDIFTFSVTVDNFNEFASKAEKVSVISLKEKTIVISYDDLLTYSGYFSSPLYFLHYLKQRKAAISVPEYRVNDELDHLGLYINQNLYALNPPQFSDVRNIFPYGFRKDLDKYFCMLFLDPSKAHKPTQNLPKKICEILDCLEDNISPEKILLAHFLLDLPADLKVDFVGQIEHVLQRQKELGWAVPVMAFGEIKYCAFITMPGIKPYTVAEQLDYTYSVASRNEKIPVMWISLEYDGSGRLISAQGKKCWFSDLEGNDIERIKIMGCKKAKDWVALYKKLHKKIGRNDNCPCGSGKKYKFCCLNNE